MANGDLIVMDNLLRQVVSNALRTDTRFPPVKTSIPGRNALSEAGEESENDGGCEYNGYFKMILVTDKTITDGVETITRKIRIVDGATYKGGTLKSNHMPWYINGECYLVSEFESAALSGNTAFYLKHVSDSTTEIIADYNGLSAPDSTDTIVYKNIGRFLPLGKIPVSQDLTGVPESFWFVDPCVS